ncbi:hypothetical protein I7R61_03950 [Neisseria meningitidis]|nr:hypothetical protein [Neisseria meningitidis]
MHRQRKRQRQKHQSRKQSRIRIFLVHKHRRPPLPKQTALYSGLTKIRTRRRSRRQYK